MDEVSNSMVHLFQRIDKWSTAFGAWSQWPDSGIQRDISDALGRYRQTRFQLLVDPRMADLKVLGKHCQLGPPSLQLSNTANPNAGILNPSAKGASMRCNFLLFRNLKPEGADDGAFNIWICNGPLTTSGGRRPITAALRIYGDSSLYERYFAYWETMREGKSAFTFAKSHTYSNLHDHQAWFFPDIVAKSPEQSMDLWKRLVAGIQETHQPAKIRLVVTGADLCHAPFFGQLADLYADQEADVKLLVADSSLVPKQMERWIGGLPLENVRFFPAVDSTQRLALATRMLLIDGPYQVSDDEPARSRRLCFLFDDDFDLSGQRSNSGTWIRLDDGRVFKDAETHWNRLWNIAAGHGMREATHLSQGKRCPWR